MPGLPRRADVVAPVVRDFAGRMGAATMLGSGGWSRSQLWASGISLSIPLKWWMTEGIEPLSISGRVTAA